MLRVTDDVLELRSWSEERGGQPCRQLDGRLALCFDPDPGPALHVGWDEFEVAFVAGRDAFAYDDAPGCRNCFVGTAEEVHAWVNEYHPRTTGAAPTHPRAS